MNACNITVRSDVLRLYASAGVTSNVIVGMQFIAIDSNIFVQGSARMGQNTMGMEFTRLFCQPESIFVILSVSEESRCLRCEILR
jgi:hypothetical protein